MSGLAAIGGTALAGAAVLTCGVAILAVGGTLGGIALRKRFSKEGKETGGADE